MFVAGVDIGSSTSKVVILERGRLLAYSIVSTGADSVSSAQHALDSALAQCAIKKADIDYVVATGYGRIIVPFAQETITELSCHARGANFLFPAVRTILDMGGQDCKAIRCDGHGKLKNFAMNDKCAAGTGRFLEVTTQVMDTPLEELGPLSLESEGAIKINSTCTVFGKTEVASLLRRGSQKRDILAGLNVAISNRTFLLLRRIGIEPDFVITGGIAKNVGVVRELEKRSGMKALIPDEPQIVGALGAALFARDQVNASRDEQPAAAKKQA
jgi:predicted CoA-substrate-specific enzyme activase